MIRLWTIRDESIEVLQLPTQLTNLLKYEGIHTVSDLLQHNRSDLLRIRGFGRTWLRHINRTLKQYDLYLE